MKSKEGEEKKFSKLNKKKHHGSNNNATKRADRDDGAYVGKCLIQEKITTFTPLELNENAMPTQKEKWKICAYNTVKHEGLLKANEAKMRY